VSRAALLLPLLLLGSAVGAEEPKGAISQPIQTTVSTLQKEALAGTRAFDVVRSLTVEVGPRLAGTERFGRAVDWGLRTLTELGFANVHPETVTLPHWERGAESGEILAPYPQPVHLCALGGSVGTPAEGIEAPVLAVPSLAALDKIDAAEVKGKIVFFDVKMQRAHDGSGYGDAVPVRGAGASAAAKKGAVAVLIRSIGTDHNRTPHTGAMRYEDGVARIPAAALSIPDAEELALEVESGKPVRFRLQLGAQYLPDVVGANVIGEVTGREKPEEVVLLACHLDSWDLGTGAIDDGAGCAIVIETARRIAQLPQKPRRTIRVVLYANEEFGLSGARAYAEAHKDQLAQHVLSGESDLGSGRPYRVSSHIDPAALPRFAALAKLLAPLGIEPGDNEAGGGADLIPLAPQRVPAFALDQDASTYFDFHHTANDTLDKIDPKDLAANVAAWVSVVYAAAEMEGDFGRAPETPGRE
jgi:hypothetical protein